jgi:hypothetical protein
MLYRGSDDYEVIDVLLEHNDLLHLPETRHLMATQRKISEVQAFEIEAADDSGLGQKMHMTWMLVKLVGHLTLATLVVTAKIICVPKDKGSWLLDKLEVC